MSFDELVTDAPERLKAIVAEVEADFGRSISIRKDVNGVLKRNQFAALCLDEGDLHILYRNGDHLAYFLAHEYLHLKRFLDGIPFVDRASRWWTTRVDNPLEHVAIYPVLAELDLGVDPYEFEKTVWSSELLAVAENCFPHHWACSCWRMLLTTRDVEYQERMLAELAARIPSAAAMGVAIADEIRKTGIRTPDEKVSVIQAVKEITKKADIVRLFTLNAFKNGEGKWFEKNIYETIDN